MLVEITIKNFAIIEELTVPFDKGLTVLTGETGAGKSIIIDAIGLLVGGRGSSEFIRYGAKRAEIEGLFTVNANHEAILKAKEFGIETEDGMIVLRRDISSQGKSICRVNGKLVTLSILREVGQCLIDIHGQHEHQTLMKTDLHLSFLDSFAKHKLLHALTEYKQLFTMYKQLANQLKKMTKDEQTLTHRLDLIQYQLNEIEKAKLQPKEDEELTNEKFKLANGEKLYKSLQDAYSCLYGDNKGLDWLSLALGHIEEAVSIDKELSSLFENVSNSYYLLEESTSKLRDHLETLEFEPNRLNEIEFRLNEINQLKRKYGKTVSDILEYAAAIEDELDDLLHKDDKVHQLQEQIEATMLDMYVEAMELSKIRIHAAEELTKAIEQQLIELYMEKTKFHIQIELAKSDSKAKIIDGKSVFFHEYGIDSVEFLLSTNPGEPLKPLAKVASGGEMSRIMLALKTIFSNHQGTTSIIFDEVDTGVSGRVAQAIAEKIQCISADSQVLCISHLPQVAAMADTHLYISKEENNGRVLTSVTSLTTTEKIEEIARMMSGAEITEVTKQHAYELISQAIRLKTNR